MGSKPSVLKAMKTIRVHFEVLEEQKLVKLPVKFIAKNYPSRTQKGLKTLKKIGSHLQTTIGT